MKNKFILGAILGIFLIGLVSASITGYVTRGSGVYEAGYTATLQSVDASGVATISVQTPEGDTKFVRVAEGETAKVDGAQISVSSLTRGTLFRRAGADVTFNVTGPAPEAIAIKTGAVGIGGRSGTHTHLIESYEKLMYTAIPYEIFGAGSQKNYVNDPGEKVVLATWQAGVGTENVLISAELFCDNPEDIAIGGFYALDLIDGNKDGFVNYNVITEGNLYSPGEQRIVYREPTSDGNSERITGITLRVICAKLEQAIDSGEPHF